MTGKTPVRFRTARARSKARDQLRELLRDTSLVQSLVIACNDRDQWTVLVGGMTARDMGAALLIGTDTLQILIKHEAEVDGGNGPVRLDFSAPAGEPGQATGRRRAPEVTQDAEGNLIPPPGEGWMGCAECNCNRWFATHRDDGRPGRLACVRCGNEVVTIPVYHGEGRA